MGQILDTNHLTTCTHGATTYRMAKSRVVCMYVYIFIFYINIYIFSFDDSPIHSPNPGHEIKETSNSEADQNKKLLSQQFLLFE